MSKIIRHVGKHGDRKIAVVFREIPGESHMCLLVYTELLGKNIHDPLIRCIESDIGQTSESLADALNRSYTLDGRPILGVLHAEGMLKKVQTELVVMIPAPGIQIKLSELNAILDKMAQGEEARRELEELDRQTGLQSPAAVARQMAAATKRKPGDPIPGIDVPVTPGSSPLVQSPQTANMGALADADIARSLREQADKMEREYRGGLAEVERMRKEAAALDGGLPTVPAISTPIVEAAPAKKRGRVKKERVVL